MDSIRDREIDRQTDRQTECHVLGPDQVPLGLDCTHGANRGWIESEIDRQTDRESCNQR